MSKVLQRSLEAKLAALDGPEWDSSDDDDEEKNVEIQKKNVPKKEKGKNAKTTKVDSMKKIKGKYDSIDPSRSNESSRIIYLGHLPYAFEESQLYTFLSQFGKVTNLRLSRAKRTGNSRGYAFIEFADAEVASIVAETMSGYFLMGEKRLVSHLLPKDKVHPDMFNGSRAKLMMSFKGELNSSSRLSEWQDKNRKEVNAHKSEKNLKKITRRLLNREMMKRQKLAQLGIDYDFPGYSESVTLSNSEKTEAADGTTSIPENEKGPEGMNSTKKRKNSHTDVSETNLDMDANVAKKDISPKQDSNNNKKTNQVQTPKKAKVEKAPKADKLHSRVKETTPDSKIIPKKAQTEVKSKSKGSKSRRKSVS